MNQKPFIKPDIDDSDAIKGADLYSTESKQIATTVAHTSDRLCIITALAGAMEPDFPKTFYQKSQNRFRRRDIPDVIFHLQYLEIL